MTYECTSVEEYIAAIPAERRDAFRRLRDVIRSNLPDGFEETIQYKMPSFVIPLSRYPQGYLDQTDTPLPFISIASQKNYISLYHSGLYANKALLDWFIGKYTAIGRGRSDMGKACIRFKNPQTIPDDLIGEPAAKISVDEWIHLYEKVRKGTKPVC